SKFGERMLPSHLRAMRDIESCRTAALGGAVYYCEACDETRYSYHSCKNRHCPKCQSNQADQWLEKQKQLLLPVVYFLVTFTLPEELRQLARSNQKVVYNILFRASSEALQKLAAAPRFVGGQIGMVGVLHTWTRALVYHPHVHYIVTGEGLSESGRWVSSGEEFLVPVKALSILFRAKVRDQLKKAGLLDEVDERVWNKGWVVQR
ncbi:MAG TPA: transposase zinc-binding domain-containing protein, partial [Blastocatellia bacterium]|nr:transposase zinc-binding domain-containing protein [Blastocatellia bacterium]